MEQVNILDLIDFYATQLNSNLFANHITFDKEYMIISQIKDSSVSFKFSVLGLSL